MNTDLELYRVFYEVVKYKNISKTAESLYISQSAITQSIQKLEKLLGGKVFYRNKSGVELTEEGKILYAYIKDSIETMKNAENIFSKYVNLEKGKIRIGAGNTLFSSLIYEPFIQFTRKYPNITFSVNSGLTETLINKLSNGELDIVVLNLPYTNSKYSNIEYTQLQKSNLSFFATKKYIEQNSINDFSDISKGTLILPKSPSTKSKILYDYCSQKKIKLIPNYEVTSSSVMKKLVLSNLGIGFTSTRTLDDIKNKVSIIHSIEAEKTYEGIATLKQAMCNKSTLEFVKIIKEYYKQN